jgi:hypothetical protein
MRRRAAEACVSCARAPADRRRRCWRRAARLWSSIRGSIRCGGPTLPDGPRRDNRSTDRPDLRVRDATGLRAKDVEGAETAVFALKAELRKAVSPTIPLVAVTADGT